MADDGGGVTNRFGQKHDAQQADILTRFIMTILIASINVVNLLFRGKVMMI